MEQEIVKRYAKDDLNVVWKPKKCIHSEICVKMLPEVYKPEEKPWIQPENATVEELRAQIDRCPSGALTYEVGGAPAGPAADAGSTATQATVFADGPLLVSGPIELEHKGEKTRIEGNTAFCRCGASGDKPFCDGSHKSAGFQG